MDCMAEIDPAVGGCDYCRGDTCTASLMEQNKKDFNQLPKTRTAEKKTDAMVAEEATLKPTRVCNGPKYIPVAI